MSDPLEMLIHIPACYVEPWRAMDPSEYLAQEPFLRVPYPMPISDGGFLTPPALAGLGGPSAHIRQLDILGRALLKVLESEKPRFHRSRSDERMIEATGTTILVTGNADRSVIFGSWDAGEPVDAALGRLNEARRILRLPTPVARAMLARTFIPGLPPPQAVLSNVMALGEIYPETALGGYDEGGGGIPIVIAAGIGHIRIVFDHRVYNPPDLVAFNEAFRLALPMHTL